MTVAKPSIPEEEYFARVEAEKKRKLAEVRREKISREGREKLKSLHWMHCPKCGMELHAVPFRSVTIDKCFSCGGLYLDNGELEKIVEGESGLLRGVFSLFKE